jgi:hypothetical protein
MTDLFRPSFRWTGAMETSLERDGHLVLPGVLQPHAVEELTAAVQRVQDLASEFTVTEPAALAVVGEPGSEGLPAAHERSRSAARTAGWSGRARCAQKGKIHRVDPKFAS